MTTRDKEDNVTTKLILDVKRMKNDGSYPIKVRVIYDRKYKDYSCGGISLTVKDFDKAFSDKPGKELKKIQLKLSPYETKAHGIIKSLHFFSFDEFNKLWRKKRIDKNKITIETAYADKIAELKENNQINTAKSYESSLSSLKEFDKKLSFEIINKGFLDTYERWMLTKPKSKTTIAIYLSCLRHLLNHAIDEGTIPRELYPFGTSKKKYKMPKKKNVKKAVQESDLAKIYNYECDPESTSQRAKDMWFFSYMCNGINMKDICLLKYKNIDQDSIIFIRAKTARNQEETEIVADLLDDMKEIIKTWGNKDTNPNDYMFPILTDGLNAKEEAKVINNFTKLVNKYIRKICSGVGIPIITTYAARHSYVTNMMQGGHPMAHISKRLGHKDTKTTDLYAGSLKKNTQEETAKALLNFKKAG
jgi:integrase